MKLIAVSQRIDNHTDRQEIRDAIDQRLIAFLLECNCLPVQVPNFAGLKNPRQCKEQNHLQNWLDRVQPDGIVLSGGNDIGKYPTRDNLEYGLVEYALSKKIPMLGICRGMQVLGVWAGEDLKPVNGHVGHKHQLNGQFTYEVNSYHNFALHKCPKDFKVTARSEDGSIEAIQHQYLPWSGIMWHPEREEPFLIDDINNVKSMLDR